MRKHHPEKGAGEQCCVLDRCTEKGQHGILMVPPELYGLNLGAGVVCGI